MVQLVFNSILKLLSFLFFASIVRYISLQAMNDLRAELNELMSCIKECTDDVSTVEGGIQTFKQSDQRFEGNSVLLTHIDALVAVQDKKNSKGVVFANDVVFYFSTMCQLIQR